MIKTQSSSTLINLINLLIPISICNYYFFNFKAIPLLTVYRDISQSHILTSLFETSSKIYHAFYFSWLIYPERGNCKKHKTIIKLLNTINFIFFLLTSSSCLIKLQNVFWSSQLSYAPLFYMIPESNHFAWNPFADVRIYKTG